MLLDLSLNLVDTYTVISILNPTQCVILIAIVDVDDSIPVAQ